MSVYVATDATVKIVKLRLTNHSGRTRQLSVTGYWELVLGDARSKTLMHVMTEIDPRHRHSIRSQRVQPRILGQGCICRLQ